MPPLTHHAPRIGLCCLALSVATRVSVMRALARLPALTGGGGIGVANDTLPDDRLAVRGLGDEVPGTGVSSTTIGVGDETTRCAVKRLW